MLNSKNRAYLRGMANGLAPILQVGKAGVTPELVESISDALEVRELVKCSVLENCQMDAKEAAQIVAERSHAEVVQVIGNKFVLFRQSKKKPVIVLPAK